ncbi:MAG: electron transfer flavoprotein subunit alpha/FixB family protein [Candidatus Promineifilaceae bacterium]|nr:electron transfer flavoprotein subunit alpha/FixB family protein [Candidatus Promineifilaceae bacterium]
MSGVWVWIEHNGQEIKSISKEVLGAAGGIAAELGQPLTALVFGDDVAGPAAQAFDLGAAGVIGCADPSLSEVRIETYGPLLAREAAARQPAVIVAGASIPGRDLMGWTAAALETGLAADVVSLAVADGRVRAVRPVYAGKLQSDVVVTSDPQMFTLRNRAFAPAEATGQSGEVEWVEPAVAADEVSTEVLGFESSAGEVSLTDATIIVSGGRGVGGPEGYAPVRELAEVLGAAVGASRAAVDAGWIPYEHQVGQTGKTVSPELYIAAGISGAIQHQAGMRTAKVIVAINKDPDAPIFKLANYGIVDDLFKVLPSLTKEFRKRLEG